MGRRRKGTGKENAKTVLATIMRQERPYDGINFADLEKALVPDGEIWGKINGMSLSHALIRLQRNGAVRPEWIIQPNRRPKWAIFPAHKAHHWMKKWKLVETQEDVTKSVSKPQKNSKIEQPDYSQAKFSPKFIELLASKGKIAVWKKTSDGWKWTQGTKEEAERLNLHVFDPQAHSKAEEVAQ